MNQSAISNSRQQWGPILKGMLGNSRAAVIGLLLAILGGLPGITQNSAGFALIGAAAALLVGFLVVVFLSHRRAEKAFFTAYAVERNMELTGKQKLPPLTPLLRKGDDRYADRVLTGSLGDGVSGRLALYTYETESRDSKGNKQTSYHRFTIGMVEIPGLAAFAPELVCQRRSGFRILEKVEDAFRSARRVTLESEAMSDRYEVFVTKNQDHVWLRRLFSPSFIVWLTEAAPEGMAFEASTNLLCVDFKGHRKNVAELDEVREVTAHIARRLREEL